MRIEDEKTFTNTMANPGKDSISGDPDTPVVTADVDFAKGQTIQTPETSLHRGLKARHITMIAIGGAVGVGLIIGTGGALGKAGYVLATLHSVCIETNWSAQAPAPFSLRTFLSASSYTWSCVPLVKWLLGCLRALALLVMPVDFATRLSGLPLDTPICSSISL
jgi:hypothetical protein